MNEKRRNKKEQKSIKHKKYNIGDQERSKETPGISCRGGRKPFSKVSPWKIRLRDTQQGLGWTGLIRPGEQRGEMSHWAGRCPLLACSPFSSQLSVGDMEWDWGTRETQGGSDRIEHHFFWNGLRWAKARDPSGFRNGSRPHCSLPFDYLNHLGTQLFIHKRKQKISVPEFMEIFSLLKQFYSDTSLGEERNTFSTKLLKNYSLVSLRNIMQKSIKDYVPSLYKRLL